MWNDWGGRATAGAVAFFCFRLLGQILIGLGVLEPGPAWQYAMIPVPMALIAIAWRTTTLPTLPVRERRGWRLIATAYGLNLLTTLFTLGLPGLSLAADICNVLVYPLLAGGVMMLAPRPAGAMDRLKFSLDALAVLVGGSMVVNYLFVDGGALLTVGVFAEVTTVAFFFGDLFLFLALVAAMLRTWPPRQARASGPLAVSLLTMFVGDLGWNYVYNRQGFYQAGGWPDLLWVAAAVLMTMAAQVAWETETGRLPVLQPNRLWRWYVQFLPYGMLSLAFGMIMYAADVGDAARGLLWLVVVVTVTVLTRQATVLWENNRLLNNGALLTEELRKSESRLRSLMQHSSDVIAVLGPDWRVAYASPAAGPLTGIDPAQLVGFRLIDLVHPDEVAATRESMVQAQHSVVRCRVRSTNGGWRHVEASVNNLLHDPTVSGIVVNVRDVTERHLMEQRLTHQAYHDALTNLGNRVLFYDHLARALQNHRETGRPLSVLFLDLDGFKTVNDSLGHAAGDRLLLEVARRLQLSVGGVTEAVARLGGDEFAVLLEETSATEAQVVAGKLLAVLTAPVGLEGREVVVEASIGIAASLAGKESADELMRNADAAMYAAKAQGKGRCAQYHPALHQLAVQRLEMEADLRGALEQNEFLLHYQPTVDLGSGRITGFEALVRWQHPQRGLIPPADFIPLAEETGLIVPLGLLVLDEACRQAALWRSETGAELLKMAVNVSARQLVEPAFVRDVARVIGRYRVPRGALVLEITETVLVEGSDHVMQALQDLKTLGVMIAIDDFGTGYSSLGYLRRFSADILKIDRSFVERLGRDGKESALVQAIAELSRTFGLTTVAEGVESGEQVAELRRLRCQGAQGFFFGRPLDAGAAGQLLGGKVRV